MPRPSPWFLSTNAGHHVETSQQAYSLPGSTIKLTQEVSPSRQGDTYENAATADGDHAGVYENDAYIQGETDAVIQSGADAPQLQTWVYEVYNANLTLAERLEKGKWEVACYERL